MAKRADNMSLNFTSFEEYVDDWYEHHKIAQFMEERAGISDGEHHPDLRTSNFQKLGWLDYCRDNGIGVSDEFRDTLFDELVEALKLEICECQIISFEDISRFLNLVSPEKANQYDCRLASLVSSLLASDMGFDQQYNLFRSWTRCRQGVLAEAKLGFPASEAGWASAFYTRNRPQYMKTRDTNFREMYSLANYYVWAYECCKDMDRQTMAGDIVKFHDFLVDFMRDVLASARTNGYDDYEGQIKGILKDLQAETAAVPSVFISYTWSDSAIADTIEQSIGDLASVRRDTHDVKTCDSLSVFMKSIRKQDFAILVVSDAYLQRRNCMYEVLQLLKDCEDESFWDKVEMYVIATGLYDGEGRAKKIEHWVNSCDSLEGYIKGLPPATSEGLVQEAKVLRYISMEIGGFLEQLSDKKHRRNLDKFIEETRDKLSAWAQYGSDPIRDVLLAYLQTNGAGDA